MTWMSTSIKLSMSWTYKKLVDRQPLHIGLVPFTGLNSTATHQLHIHSTRLLLSSCANEGKV